MKSKCIPADFMPEQHITHDKHVLKASKLCVNSASSIHNAKAHAAHCMVNWYLQVPVELRVEQIPIFIFQIPFSESHTLESEIGQSRSLLNLLTFNIEHLETV